MVTISFRYPDTAISQEILKNQQVKFWPITLIRYYIMMKVEIVVFIQNRCW